MSIKILTPLLDTALRDCFPFQSRDSRFGPHPCWSRNKNHNLLIQFSNTTKLVYLLLFVFQNATKAAVITILLSVLVISSIFPVQCRPQGDVCSDCCLSYWAECMSQCEPMSACYDCSLEYSSCTSQCPDSCLKWTIHKNFMSQEKNKCDAVLNNSERSLELLTG